MHENLYVRLEKNDEFHSFASELSRAANVIVLSDTWVSANTCHDVQGYTGFHTYRADKTGGSVCVSQKLLHIDPYGQFSSVSCIV